MKLTLQMPFKRLDGELCSELTLRSHLTGGDILFARRLPGGISDDLIFSFGIVSRVAGLDMAEVEAMSTKDIEAVQKHIAEIESKKEA